MRKYFFPVVILISLIMLALLAGNSAVRTKNTVASADSDGDLEKTDTGMEKVQIKEVDLCEEESEWLRK